ncbi:MAG: hypothetical protein Q8922_09775 [Bacteroidota bacterium]|nr:hypothetical protein [Bacteroidota bacterium]MDP4232843.1 hypothetical protein [Bacteroidota bacterium]MDP4241887.1 hypothetical protein [Bacteroidota bacterium]MDP4288212.1 hypothetical protein [Bacteroidota bacterium]
METENAGNVDFNEGDGIDVLSLEEMLGIGSRPANPYQSLIDRDERFNQLLRDNTPPWERILPLND